MSKDKEDQNVVEPECSLVVIEDEEYRKLSKPILRILETTSKKVGALENNLPAQVVGSAVKIVARCLGAGLMPGLVDHLRALMQSHPDVFPEIYDEETADREMAEYLHSIKKNLFQA